MEAKTAARDLSLSRGSVYKLLRVFRSNPVTASLLPRKPGLAKGTRLLDEAMEAQITSSIEAAYLKRERPTLKGVLRQFRADGRKAGLAAPSMNALRARVSARTLRERVKAREGAAAAGNQFRQVRPGLQTARPLQVVQTDHTPVDLMLVDDAPRTCIGRPWLTLALDVHTRMVLGSLLSLDPPCATSAALVVAQAVLPKQAWLMDRAIDLEVATPFAEAQL